MERILLLWKLELKQTVKQLPKMLFMAILLFAILGAIAYGTVMLLYGDSPMLQITVVVIEEEENPLTDLVMQYVQEMESISKSCLFLTVSEEEGFSMLQEGKAAAALVLPSGMVEGILNGNNVPVQVYFPKNAGLESALLKELTDAGVRMLRVAQAEIYGIYDTARTYETLDELSVLEADIDRFNLAFALDRLSLFRVKEVSAAGNLTIVQYGISAGLIFFLMLLGMTCYPMMKTTPDAFRKQLARQGVGVGMQCFGKWLCGLTGMVISFACFWILLRSILGYWGYAAWLPDLGGKQLGTAVLMLLCVTTYTFFIFQITDNGVAAILLLFFLSTVMAYCSGGLLPSAFLPGSVWKIGRLLPTAYLLEAAKSLYLGKLSGKTTGFLLLYTAGFGAVSYGIRRRAGI